VQILFVAPGRQVSNETGGTFIGGEFYAVMLETALSKK
jgi:hypothetical protein